MGTHLRIGAKRIGSIGPAGRGSVRKAAAGRRQRDGSRRRDLGLGYGELRRFSPRFEVIPFPYDWRHSLAVEGERLADAVEAVLRKHKRPVHLLAHGAGGLVALGLIARAARIFGRN